MWIFGESTFQAERRADAWVSGQEHLQCLDNMKAATVAKESKWENGGDKIKR